MVRGSRIILYDMRKESSDLTVMFTVVIFFRTYREYGE